VKRVTAPPGCRGIDLQDGTRYNANRQGVMQVADHHADVIQAGWYGQSGVMVGNEPHRLGTKVGRQCACSPLRIWNAWNKTCPKCGADTVEEKAP
jgi:hypothetical protein